MSAERTVRFCRVCNDANPVPVVKRDRLPAMQNYVYRTAEDAKNSALGDFNLVFCRSCSFVYNATFDTSLLHYDAEYDNSVPSQVMAEYYERIATYLLTQYSIDDGLVIDVGCGNGTFLGALAKISTRVRGLGIDPSYDGETESEDGRIQFVRDHFTGQYITERPKLIVCRHVLEHIEEPLAFLESLVSAVDAYPGTPFFFEVPNAQWIIENDAFWDFCYEHCNYFLPGSLHRALEIAGLHAQPGGFHAFGGMYLWMEARNGTGQDAWRGPSSAQSKTLQSFAAYAVRETETIRSVKQRLLELKADGWSLAIWGMAAKGVMFSFMIDADRSLIDHCVDVNANKHGCFVPVTAHPIEPPAVLRKLGGSPLMVVVMNSNYLAEIRVSCREMGLSPTFMDAAGQSL